MSDQGICVLFPSAAADQNRIDHDAQPALCPLGSVIDICPIRATDDENVDVVWRRTDLSVVSRRPRAEEADCLSPDNVGELLCYDDMWPECQGQQLGERPGISACHIRPQQVRSPYPARGEQSRLHQTADFSLQRRQRRSHVIGKLGQRQFTLRMEVEAREQVSLMP